MRENLKLTEQLIELNNLTAQFCQDSENLEAIETQLAEVNSNLITLENDTDIDFTTARSQAQKLSEQVPQLEFEVRALTKRQETLRSEIVAQIHTAEQSYSKANNQARRERIAAYNAFKESPEWEGVQKQIIALYGLKLDFATWDGVLSDLMPYPPEYREARDAAKELNLYVDDPEEPEEIDTAKHFINYTKFNDKQ